MSHLAAGRSVFPVDNFVDTSPALRASLSICAFARALVGHGSLETAAGELCGGLGADAVRLSRRSLDAPGGPRAAPLLFATGAAGRLVSGERLAATGSPLLGAIPDRARLGSVWSLRDLEPGEIEAAGPWTPAPGLSADLDVQAIVLDSAPDRLDVIELIALRRFADRFGEGAEPGRMVPHLLVDAWQNRLPGLCSDMIAGSGGAPAGPAPDALSCDNPYALTRAEFRVCQLLTRGLAIKRIARELGISANTVRSHLRRIYEKTETHGQQQLLLVLLGGDAAARAIRRPAGPEAAAPRPVTARAVGE
jgi:DNA-binding CsgD family transcriptional regulator